MEQDEYELVQDKYTGLKEHVSPAAEGHIISGSCFDGHDAIVNESAYYERFILDDFDNYLDEINDRLTVSRLVSDSVIKGMVSAILEETTEKVAVKDAEIAVLNKKLQTRDYSWTAIDRLVPPVVLREPLWVSLDCDRISWLQDLHTLDKSSGCLIPDYFGKIRGSLDRQVQRLKEEIENLKHTNHHIAENVWSARMEERLHSLGGSFDYLRVMLDGILNEVSDLFSSMEVSQIEHRWEHDLCEDITNIALQNFLRDVEEEYEAKLLKQRELISNLRTNYQLKVSELSEVHKDLDAIFMTLSNSDSGLLSSHTTTEYFEELNNTKWKDQFPVKASGDDHSPFASHPEENGTTVMQEPAFLKKLSKEELSSYYITEMTKMRRQHDKAMEEKTDELFRLKREFLKEKGSLLSKKDKELEHLKKNIRRVVLKLNDLQATLASSQFFLHSSVKVDLLKQIAKLKDDLNDLNLVMDLREDLDAIILKEMFEQNLCIEYAEMKANFVHEIYSVLFRELTSEANSLINGIMMEQALERTCLEALVSKKEIELLSEIEEKNNLMQEMTSLSLLLSEKEKVASEAWSTLMLQKQHFDLVNKELDMLRSDVNMQKVIISENNIQSDLIRNQLDETLKQIHLYETEIGNMNQKLIIASRSLEKSEREKIILHEIIKAKENELSYSSAYGNKQQIKQIEKIVSSLNILSEVSIDFQSKLTKGINRIESRLTSFSSQCNSLKQEVILLQKKGLWYKRMFEIRNSDLQKAEAEVDLLGDEVDALVSLLGKVYVALDHYSPVLQHYPGVMDVLKLSGGRKWEELEMECLSNIFSRLALDDLTMAVPFVCRSWFTAASNPNAWRVLNFRLLDFMPWSSFAKRFAAQYLVSRFSFSGFLKLAVRHSHGVATELMLPRHLTSMEDLVFASKGCPRLKTLALPNLALDDEACIPNLFVKWKALEKLEMESKPFNFPVLAAAVGKNCKNFNELVMPCSSIKREDAFAIVTWLPKLRSLDLSGSYLPKEELLFVLEGCRELDSLTAKNCVGFEADDAVKRKAFELKILEHEGSELANDRWHEIDECDDLHHVYVI
ncbi:hypothetical protein HPP92_017711 [Vanilla planifolia]|uniref:F-box domain-containing protein n=1 Tax=Vanilla planifolia TaxID=51239 RepID=A0A835Q4H0_VANPL|nr:hypothetical protein HPP92_017711 [Vanilla planifolia]